MKREIAEAWIADLRTNPPQATGQLYDGEGYCCLGRLCLVVGATFEKRIDEDGLFPVLNGTMLSEHEMLPDQIQSLVNMNSNDGAYGENNDDTLTTLNDDGLTFAEIADIIEKHWQEL